MCYKGTALYYLLHTPSGIKRIHSNIIRQYGKMSDEKNLL